MPLFVDLLAKGWKSHRKIQILLCVKMFPTTFFGPSDKGPLSSYLQLVATTLVRHEKWSIRPNKEGGLVLPLSLDPIAMINMKGMDNQSIEGIGFMELTKISLMGEEIDSTKEGSIGVLRKWSIKGRGKKIKECQKPRYNWRRPNHVKGFTFNKNLRK